MEHELTPPDGDQRVVREIEMSGLRDEMTTIRRRMSAALGGGLAISALFVVAGGFMEKSSTLWFLGGMWLLLTARLVTIHRASGREMRLKEAALESLASPPGDDA